MGHLSDNEYLRYYQPKLMDIDFQGLVLRGQQDQGVDYSKLLRSERGRRPPTELPAVYQTAVREKLELSDLQPGTQVYYQTKRSLNQQAWKDFLCTWHNDRDSIAQSSRRGPSALIPDSSELLGDLLMAETQAKLKLERFCIDYPLIREAFDAEKFDMRSPNGLLVLKTLINVAKATKAETCYWYPDSLPVREFLPSNNVKYTCSVCKLDMTKYVDCFLCRLGLTY